MSLTLKLTSLGVRTLAKPIANAIKSRARDHERFRRICITIAQGLHRIDMRMRLGLLQDPAAIERQIARETREAEKRKKASEVPTVKTEAETKQDEAEREKTKHLVGDKVKKEHESAMERRIRPLSDAKAIDSGANFISETFLFLVAGGLIVFETWRSRRKESTRREDVKERIEKLEEEFMKTVEEKSALQAQVHALEDEVHKLTPQAVKTSSFAQESKNRIEREEKPSEHSNSSKTKSEEYQKSK